MGWEEGGGAAEQPRAQRRRGRSCNDRTRGRGWARRAVATANHAHIFDVSTTNTYDKSAELAGFVS
eukprot:5466470-Pleurochrysis_carterae.AAC.1